MACLVKNWPAAFSCGRWCLIVDDHGKLVKHLVAQIEVIVPRLNKDMHLTCATAGSDTCKCNGMCMLMGDHSAQNSTCTMKITLIQEAGSNT